MLRGHADEEEQSDQKEQHGNQNGTENIHAGAEEIADAAADEPAALHSGSGAEQFACGHIAVRLI